MSEQETDPSPARDVPCADLPLPQRVEAVLLAADRPMADGRIADVLGLELGAPQVRAAIDELNAGYEATGRTFRIEQVAGGRQVMTISALGPVVARLRGERAQARLTQAALETLAVVAYRQPILRADIEAIRGVACGEVLRSLMERRMVRIVGRSEEIGRPMLYGTTGEFLRTFGIASISDLPQAKDLKAP